MDSKISFMSLVGRYVETQHSFDIGAPFPNCFERLKDWAFGMVFSARSRLGSLNNGLVESVPT